MNMNDFFNHIESNCDSAEHFFIKHQELELKRRIKIHKNQFKENLKADLKNMTLSDKQEEIIKGLIDIYF